MNVLIGLVAPITIGYADFLGAKLGRRGQLLATVLWIQTSMMAWVVVLAVIWGGNPTPVDLLLGGCSGLTSSLALIQLYRGYTSQGVGIVGPVAAVTGAAIPIAVDALIVGLPSWVVSSGMLVGLVSIWLIGIRNPSGEWDSTALRFGLQAGVLFGTSATLLGLVTNTSGLWPALSARAIAVFVTFLVVVLSKEAIRLPKDRTGPAVLVGCIASVGFGCFALAAQSNLAIAGLFYQMTYGVTLVYQVILAGERTTRTQVVGFALAIVALAMILLG